MFARHVNPPLHPSRRDLLRLAALGGFAGSALGTIALPAGMAAGPAWAAGGAFTIGRGKWNGGEADHFPGRIDQVKVWTRALTDADVRVIG
ncbi:LamG-like jellyroll fold domain-containing protein [Dactylosporangium sp. NPDC048998]|uniref:LamG-like jellyroll fold domain-containing protein n=1 Tax=Dactylosporangium sp. NPDC048998 TaxID=3363976 RepID=UPI00371A9D11